VLVEGPVDALALAACGLPAVSLVETRPPAWLTERTFGRRVAVALDADPAGDAAATALLGRLRELGADAFRWRPPAVDGVKDWADLVKPGSGQAGSLPGLVAALLGHAESTPSAPPAPAAPVTLRRARGDWEGAAPGTAGGELARRFYRLVRAAAIATDAGEDDDVGPYLDRVGIGVADLAERFAVLRAGRASPPAPAWGDDHDGAGGAGAGERPRAGRRAAGGAAGDRPHRSAGVRAGEPDPAAVSRTGVD
jgi:hypothetical protein